MAHDDDSDTYVDGTVRIDATTVTILRYYFPWGGAKTIARSDIVAVSVRPTTWSIKWRI